jgi:hypothetical protein
MPELCAIGPKSYRMGRPGKHNELPILDRKLAKEVEQIVLARNAVRFATGDQHRRRYLQWINKGQFCDHIFVVISR